MAQYSVIKSSMFTYVDTGLMPRVRDEMVCPCCGTSYLNVVQKIWTQLQQYREWDNDYNF